MSTEATHSHRSGTNTAPNDKIRIEANAMSGGTNNPKNYEARIVRDGGICGGEPVFKGTRVTLRTVLASLAGGDSVADILSDFPSLKAEDIQAAIAFAGASAEEYLPVPAVPHVR
jgi:uncharacterized protein (DUF433 family)